MFSLEGIKAIAELISLRLHLQKLAGRSQLCTLALSPNYIIHMLMDLSFSLPKCQHLLAINSLMSHQRSNVKNHLVDSNNKLYGIFSSFSPFHLELSLGSRIINIFSDHFSFSLSNRNKNDKICH